MKRVSNMKRLCCLFLCGVLFLCACNSVPTEAPSELKIETEAPTEQNTSAPNSTEQNTGIEQTTEQNDETENNDPNSKGSADFWAGCDEGEDGTLNVYIKEGGEEFEEELTKIGYGYNKVVVSYVKYSQMDLLAQKEHLTERIQKAGKEISEIITKCYAVMKMNGITVEVSEDNEEKKAKIRKLADDPEIVTVTYTPVADSPFVYYAGRYVDSDGTMVVCIKKGGEAFEEVLAKGFSVGYDKVRVSYVKYSQVDILTQYGHLKERIQNAGEEIYGIVKAYGTGFQGITVSVNENNEEKMAKIRALADDPEVVTVQYVEGEPVNH